MKRGVIRRRLLRAIAFALAIVVAKLILHLLPGLTAVAQAVSKSLCMVLS